MSPIRHRNHPELDRATAERPCERCTRNVSAYRWDRGLRICFACEEAEWLREHERTAEKPDALMARKPRVPKTKDEEIAVLIEAGLSMTEIKRDVKSGSRTIKRVAFERGLTITVGSSGRPFPSRQQPDAVEAPV